MPPSRGDTDRQLSRSLLGCVAAAALAIAFFALGGEVLEGDTQGLDIRLLHAAASLRAAHPWLPQVLRDLSALGGTTVLALVTLLAAGYLALAAGWRTAALVAVSVGAGSTLVAVFKQVFGRLRPDPALADLVVPGLSFPSGHAGTSAIVYLTLGALVAASRSRPAERLFILAAAAQVTMLVGASRAALGVHWATDVLGGWAFGAAWAAGGLVLDRQVRHWQSRA
jgi:undecaprenyl-diphosphatase